MSRFIVKVSAAKMPNSCWGKYARIAVLEISNDHNGPVKMISARSRGVVRVVETWERLHVGRTRGAYWTAKAEADTLANTLNHQE